MHASVLLRRLLHPARRVARYGQDTAARQREGCSLWGLHPSGAAEGDSGSAGACRGAGAGPLSGLSHAGLHAQAFCWQRIGIVKAEFGEVLNLGLFQVCRPVSAHFTGLLSAQSGDPPQDAE